MREKLTEDQIKAIREQTMQNVDNHGKAIAYYLKKARREKGLTQQELADCLGISRDSINDYEKSGDLKFPTRIFLSMCEILDCSPQYLMGIDKFHHRETTDIHASTNLSEDAADGLMNRMVEAYKNGITFDTYNQLLLSDLISYVISHFDDKLLIEYVESYACSEIGNDIIEDAKSNGYKIKEIDDPLTKIIQSKMFHERSARCAKVDLGNKFMNDLEEWVKGISDEYSAMLLEKGDHYRK